MMASNAGGVQVVTVDE